MKWQLKSELANTKGIKKQESWRKNSTFSILIFASFAISNILIDILNLKEFPIGLYRLKKMAVASVR